MAVKYVSDTDANVLTNSVITMSHTVPAMSDGLLLVWYTTEGFSGVPTCTFDGDALTLLDSLTGGSQYLRCWYMLSPAAKTANVVVTITGGHQQQVCAVNISGVLQADPFSARQTDSEDVGDSSASVSISTGVFKIAGISVDYQHTITGGAGQTQLCSQYSSSGYTNTLGVTYKDGGTATVSQSWSGSETYRMMGFYINPAPAGGNPAAVSPFLNF